MSDPSKLTCPHICPTNATGGKQQREYPQAESLSRISENPHAYPYVPGYIQPPEQKVYPPDAPPRYLPQPTDSTSGDILGMGPVGPWAAGHLDWTPQAGTTGVRPVVDKYSISRYSTGEWRKNNQFTLIPRATDKAKAIELTIKSDLQTAFKNLDNKLSDTNTQLEKRVKNVSQWKEKVEKTIKDITQEIDTLDQDRTLLKAASRILNLPEAISKECLELRTNRYEPDLVRDDAEQELIKEVAIVGEIRRVFNNTLAKVEEQMLMNKAAKTSIEFDWGDKMLALKVDKQLLSLTPESNLLLYHPGVARWPENSTTAEYWEHYCSESIRNCEEVRKKSEELRADLKTILINGGQDMKLQADRTNAALAETISTTEELCSKLEETLENNLKTIADVENLIEYFKESLRNLDERAKLTMTRLHARNYDRPNVENCQDDVQYALIGEAKFLKETTELFSDRMRQAEAARSELMKYRGDLEKDIACKRKSLNIDQDRLARIRAHMPSPEEFAAVSMVAGVAVYPAAWSETSVQETCGPTADQYNIGRCHIRWAYLLAVIGCLDGIVLAALAFILATRHVRLQPDSGYPPPSLYKGEVNNAYVTDATSVSGSRKSLALQPVLIMHPHAPMDMDTYSHYSGRTARSKHGIYANTMHNNYQL